MAPEYFTADNYDGKSVDVWALGIMLDQLLHNF
jgi:serine/threonine protein kinase